jgi:hypothetical protein
VFGFNENLFRIRGHRLDDAVRWASDHTALRDVGPYDDKRRRDGACDLDTRTP